MTDPVSTLLVWLTLGVPLYAVLAGALIFALLILALRGRRARSDQGQRDDALFGEMARQKRRIHELEQRLSRAKGSADKARRKARR